MGFLTEFILWFNYAVLAYYTVANLCYLALLLLAVKIIFTNLMRLDYGEYQDTIHPSVAPPVSMLISAFNEEANIVDSVKALLTLNYPDYEVIVINDGSSDSTLARLKEAFSLTKTNTVYRPLIPTAEVHGFYVNPENPKLLVVDKAHSGKADSLNAGINISRTPYFCSVDADSILEKDAIKRIMRPIIENPDLVKATGGIVKIINGSTVSHSNLVNVRLPKDSLSRLQIVEYTRSFLFGRAGLSAVNSLLVIAGAFSMFHKKSVLDIGGYNTKSVTEDMELVVRLHKHLRESGQKYIINFIPDPICWTEAPTSMTVLKKQRMRWHTGLVATILAYKGMLLNPRYGRVGLFAMPYQFFIELAGPLVEFLGLFVSVASYFLGIINLKFFFLFLTMSILVGVFFSTASILLEEITFRRYKKLRELFLLLLYGVFENFGYRQVVAFWRSQAVLRFIVSGARKWDYVKKRGFSMASGGNHR